MFKDRWEAGEKLAEQLQSASVEGVIVLALPRGGVPVGYEIAKRLGIPLDVLIVRKLGVPGQEELAMGAIGPENVTVLNEDVIQMLNIRREILARVIHTERAELDRRLQCFRGERPFPDLTGKTVILADDGLATGATAMAAIRAIRTMRPARIILAVPVCAADSLASVRRLADEVLCLETPSDFQSVGHWYQSFPQLTDEEVLRILREAWHGVTFSA